jgi:CRISPR-associated protein Cas6
MYWQEDIKEEHFTIPDKIQDAVFNIECNVLPIDHSYLLYKSLVDIFPWLEDVNAGIHDISVADGNGWEQNYESGFFYPSKRSKLTIRLPKGRLNEIQSLVNKTLEIGEYRLKVIKQLDSKLMSDMQVLFAKNVAYNKELTEGEFLEESFNHLCALGVNAKKMMAGLERVIKTPDAKIYTKSLMLASLKKSESVAIQESGIGEHRLLGCGLFVPQKDIESVAAV